jgi:hypothetical protein
MFDSKVIGIPMRADALGGANVLNIFRSLLQLNFHHRPLINGADLPTVFLHPLEK